jgi:A/G-specific adenine glycosylase
MLQQTQVSRVVPRFEQFLGRFPTPAICAGAPVADLVRAWHGLGYNRRAVSLHGAATVVVERHHGRLPSELDALLALPGVGAYTARAVLAFAFERDVGVVDTNAGRVLAAPAVSASASARPRTWPPATCLLGRAGPGTRPCWTWGPRFARGGHPAAASARCHRSVPGVRPAWPNRILPSARRAPVPASPGSPARTARAEGAWSRRCAWGRSLWRSWLWWPAGPTTQSGHGG